MCGGQGPVLRLGPVVEEMHHAGGKRQDEPVGAEHHEMPREYRRRLICTRIAVVHLRSSLAVSLFETLKLLENTVILTWPRRSSSREFNTRIHLRSSPLKATACSVFSPCAHNFQASASKNRPERHIHAEESISATEQLDFKEATCTLGTIHGAASITHL